MRIISDFRDYYDGVIMANYTAQDRVYVRKYQEVARPKDLVESPYKAYLNSDWHILLFAGQAFYGLQLFGYWGSKNSPGKLIFNLEDLDKAAQYHKEGGELARYNKPLHKHTTETPRDRFSKKFETFKPHKVDHQIFRNLDSPIIVCRARPYSNIASHRNTIYLNPSLKELGFSVVLGAEQAAQELEMFFHSSFLEHPKPMVQVSDINRLEAHGFDKKTSFRGPSKTKKG